MDFDFCLCTAVLSMDGAFEEEEDQVKEAKETVQWANTMLSALNRPSQ